MTGVMKPDQHERDKVSQTIFMCTEMQRLSVAHPLQTRRPRRMSSTRNFQRTRTFWGIAAGLHHAHSLCGVVSCRRGCCWPLAEHLLWDCSPDCRIYMETRQNWLSVCSQCDMPSS